MKNSAYYIALTVAIAPMLCIGQIESPERYVFADIPKAGITGAEEESAMGEPTPGLAGAAASGTAYTLGGGAGHEDTTKVRRLRKAPGLKLKVSTALE